MKKSSNKNTSSSLEKKRAREIFGSKVILNIHSTFNNTIFTISKENGEAIFQVSPRKIGFKGARRATPYASQKTAESVVNQIVEMGVSRIGIRSKGFGPGRDSAQRKISSMCSIIKIESFTDATGVAHGGVRHRKMPSK